MSMNIDSFKAQLRGGGARPNLFEVQGSFPNASNGALSAIGQAVAGQIGAEIGTAIGNALGSGGPSNKIRFLCKAAQLPAQTINPVPVRYRGREVKFPGDRMFENWTITIINDTDFALRDAFEQWSNLINSHEGNIGISALEPICQDWSVTQLGKQGERLKTYNIIGCWPSLVSPIDLSYDNTDIIEEFQITLEYQYWTADTTT